MRRPNNSRSLIPCKTIKCTIQFLNRNGVIQTDHTLKREYNWCADVGTLVYETSKLFESFLPCLMNDLLLDTNQNYLYPPWLDFDKSWILDKLGIVSIKKDGYELPDSYVFLDPLARRRAQAPEQVDLVISLASKDYYTRGWYFDYTPIIISYQNILNK